MKVQNVPSWWSQVNTPLGGMTWSESGAEGMLQIRTSLASGRFLHDFRHTLRSAA